MLVFLYFSEDISGNISDPILKGIVKYRNHPCMKAIRKVPISSDSFSFDIVNRKKILEEISSLDHIKACQQSDIPTKIIKENSDIFQKFLNSRLMLQSIKEPFHQFSNC